MGIVGVKMMSYYQPLVAYRPKCYYSPSLQEFWTLEGSQGIIMPDDARLISLEDAMAISATFETQDGE